LTANENTTSIRIRFYGSLEVGLAAWVATMFAIGGTFNFASLPLYIVILLGALAILGAGMRHPVYRTIRDGR
jgi:hypothetical protein